MRRALDLSSVSSFCWVIACFWWKLIFKFNLIYFFFCFNVLSPCSLLIWHCCRAHLFHGKCEMISVLTDINKLPDPINKLLVVSCLALSHANLAIAGQVQIYWGRNQRRSSVCLCVFLRRHAQCLYAESKSLYICTTCKWSVTARTPELQLNLFSPDIRGYLFCVLASHEDQTVWIQNVSSIDFTFFCQSVIIAFERRALQSLFSEYSSLWILAPKKSHFCGSLSTFALYTVFWLLLLLYPCNIYIRELVQPLLNAIPYHFSFPSQFIQSWQ